MRRFDLGMSLSYCPSWGVVESIREYFQNAFDAQTENSSNEMYFSYNEDTETLQIGNKCGILNTDSLLLGQTSKSGKDELIGKHGEGYKVATVVLLRHGKGVKVYNRSKKEVWTAKVVNSRRYKTAVVVFDIEKVSIFESVPNHDLIFEVTGITKDEYTAIYNSNLHLQTLVEKEDYIVAGNSKVLLDERFAGKLYVGGLYVTTSKYAKLGYDFEPSLIKLDRDRSFIDGLDLQFLCGKVISATNNLDFIKAQRKSWDGSYIRFFLDTYCSANFIELYDEAYSEFIDEYGKDAIPTTSTEEFNRLQRNGYNAVMVTENDYSYISRSASYSTSVDDDSLIDKLADDLESWFNEYIDVDSDAYKYGNDLIEKVLTELRS